MADRAAFAPRRRVFRGQIAGVGSASGIRVVVGRWAQSPFGGFADAMVQRRDGHRVLLAPTAEVADLVSTTYTVDEVRIEPLSVVVGTPPAVTWSVRSPSLSLDLILGRRTPLGMLLRSAPQGLATSAAWAGLLDPFARVLLRGVRTRGIARPGRREWYAASDHRAVTHLWGTFEGTPLGAIAPVDPPCQFGFSSTPRRPSVTAVTTTIEDIVRG